MTQNDKFRWKPALFLVVFWTAVVTAASHYVDNSDKEKGELLVKATEEVAAFGGQGTVVEIYSYRTFSNKRHVYSTKVVLENKAGDRKVVMRREHAVVTGDVWTIHVVTDEFLQTSRIELSARVR